MSERITRKFVDFARSFELDGVEGPQSPGRYEVETVEEQIDGLSFIAFRRLYTTIAVPEPGRAAPSIQLARIDPSDLAHALDEDAKPPRAKPQIQSRSDGRPRSRSR